MRRIKPRLGSILCISVKQASSLSWSAALCANLDGFAALTYQVKPSCKKWSGGLSDRKDFERGFGERVLAAPQGFEPRNADPEAHELFCLKRMQCQQNQLLTLNQRSHGRDQKGCTSGWKSMDGSARMAHLCHTFSRQHATRTNSYREERPRSTNVLPSSRRAWTS